jgi:hypothetical protein
MINRTIAILIKTPEGILVTLDKVSKAKEQDK